MKDAKAKTSRKLVSGLVLWGTDAGALYAGEDCADMPFCVLWRPSSKAKVLLMKNNKEDPTLKTISEINEDGAVAIPTSGESWCIQDPHVVELVHACRQTGLVVTFVPWLICCELAGGGYTSIEFLMMRH